MKNWKDRPSEIAYLLNPAFCARLLYTTIKAYNTESNRAFPFPLVYLILPILLHRKTRTLINTKSRLPLFNWIQNNTELFIGFADRAKNLVPITNEGLEILLQSEYVSLTADASIEYSTSMKTMSNSKFIDAEITECLNKCTHLAKWFVNAGKSESIYINLGVRP